MRFGVLGTGFWAQHVHAAALAEHPGAELVGVWGRDLAKAKAVGAEFDVPGHADVDALLRDVDAVAVSHRHFDHFLDLYPYFFVRWSAGRGPIPLFGPPGFFEHALQLEPQLPEAFSPVTVAPGETFEAGPLRIATTPMRHPVPTLGMRIEAGHATLAYSADTGPAEELVTLAAGADVLLCEATWLDPVKPDLHLTAAEAGDHGRRGETDRLVVTHVAPTNDRRTVLERASAAFGKPATVAVEGMRVDVGGGGGG
jgi:ribonuclease BN (tRNA processing enzyme)